MLYTYKSCPHDFDKLHTYVRHTVLNVWCKASGPFKISMLHKDFQPMVKEVSKHENDYLLSPIKLIYNRFSKLNKVQIEAIRQGFHNNNALEKLCNGKVSPMLFKEIEGIDKTLHNHLNRFGKNLYMHLTAIKACVTYAGDINAHYKNLVNKNKSELCPFCGLNDIKSHRLSKRDAFDHFFSKDKYPFNSVNPLNLAPMCDDCNSSYKNQYDPIRDEHGNKRKIFYPFSKSKHTINLSIDLKMINISKLEMHNLSINFKCKGKDEEAGTWAELFGLDERYKDKCCKEKDGKTWYRKVIDDGRNYGKTPKEMYNLEVKVGKIRPLSDNNFLRIPFLNACNAKGII